ncbi:class I SAM-dependent methyltransferase [Streptomyces sp. NPDC058701]|uniref:class I SAM-dependent methyltransferase n=1 Tax=Streptomyces sp. NPDC058701 TaxID=3346608 RepID=UPI003667171A
MRKNCLFSRNDNDLINFSNLAGRSASTPEQLRRMALQSTLYEPVTRALITSAGIAQGSKVLDIGSGAGDFSFLLADVVGPGGSVVGVDHDPMMIATARDEAEKQKRTNVQFLHADVRSAFLDCDYDAVAGRWILAHLPRADHLLRSLIRYVRPGGTVAFQEFDRRLTGATSLNPSDLEGLSPLLTRSEAASSPGAGMGLELHTAFLKAGIPAPHLALSAPVGAGPGWLGYDYLAADADHHFHFPRPNDAPTACHADRAISLRERALGAGAAFALPPLVAAHAQLPEL